MKSNVEKCKIMHIRNSSDHVNYTLNESDLAIVKKEKDLGIIIINHLKTEKHISEAVKTTSKLISFVGMTFQYNSKKVLLTLFNALVRPTSSTTCSFGRLTTVNTSKSWREGREE